MITKYEQEKKSCRHKAPAPKKETGREKKGRERPIADKQI
jgi:hypothetical protein